MMRKCVKTGIFVAYDAGGAKSTLMKLELRWYSTKLWPIAQIMYSTKVWAIN